MAVTRFEGDSDSFAPLIVSKHNSGCSVKDGTHTHSYTHTYTRLTPEARITFPQWPCTHDAPQRKKSLAQEKQPVVVKHRTPIHRRRNRGGAEGALAPPILGIMCIKYAEFILDTPFGPPQSCLRSYASAIVLERFVALIKRGALKGATLRG